MSLGAVHRQPRAVRLPVEVVAVRWGPVVAAAGAAVTLAVLDLTLWTGGPGSLLTWLAAALLGGAGALALDEPAAAVTEAAPYPLRRRLATRLLVMVAGSALWLAYAAAVVADQPSGSSASWFAVAAIGTALVTAGPALELLLVGPDSRENGALVASVLVAAVVGLLVIPLPFGWVPFDIAPPTTVAPFWCAAAAAAVAVVARRATR